MDEHHFQYKMVSATPTTSLRSIQSTDLHWQLHHCSRGIQQTHDASTSLSTAFPESLLIKPRVYDGRYGYTVP